MTKTLRTTVLTLSVLALTALAACGSGEQVSLGTGANSAAGAPAQEAVTTTTVPGPTEVYLGDLVPLGDSGAWQHGSVKMNTTNYEHSVWATRPCHTTIDGTATEWTFDLNRQYSKISGIVGVTDDSDATDKFKVTILNESNNAIASYEVALGVTAGIDVPVAGSLRLKIQITQTAGTPCDTARVVTGSRIAFGDVKVTK